MSIHKLSYWKLPGRAEASRLALHCSGLNWENHILNRETWSILKESLLPTLPQVNIPLLEVDGKYLVESNAILRYIGSEGGLMPIDNWERAKIDEAIQMTEEIWIAYKPTFAIKDENERYAARVAICAVDGNLWKVMMKINIFCKNLNNGNHFISTTGELSIGDIAIFAATIQPCSGWMDGIPIDFLNQFIYLSIYNKKVGTHSIVSTRYKNSIDPFHKAFQFEE